MMTPPPPTHPVSPSHTWHGQTIWFVVGAGSLVVWVSCCVVVSEARAASPSELHLWNNGHLLIWLAAHQFILYYLIITIIYYSSSQFVFIYFFSFWFSSHILFLMADANAIYLSPKSYYLLLINTFRITWSSLFTSHHHTFFFFFFPHILQFWWLMLMPCIIQVLLFITHLFIMSSTHIFPHFGWLMLTSFSSYFLSHLTFVQSGIHSVVSSYACSMVYLFKLFYL